MKKYLKYIFVLILFLMIVVPNKVSATSSSSEYTIESYDIDMVVNENNTFEITERITANFNVSKHGIFRKIPLKNTVTRNDGTKSTNRAKITNISVNEDYTTYKENGYEVIKIGSSSQTYIGRRSYTIKYTYNIGKDPLKDADELYFNLIGDEWDTSISNVSFKIRMPKAFDKSLLGFTSGNTGSIDSSNVSYSIDGNIITGKTNNTLYSGQALTVRLTLPDGYFVKTSANVDLVYSVFVLIVSLSCIGLITRMWLKQGKDDVAVETVEFYPPEGYNSAEISFLYKGKTDKKSIVSLLIYLANKGYLKIEEALKHDKKKDFIIKKIKNYDGNNELERLFFEGLFSVDKSYVKLSELYNKFYKTITKIEASIINKYENIIYEKTKKEGFFYLFTFIIIFIIALKIMMEYFGISGTKVLLLIPIIVLADAFVSLMISAIGISEPPLPIIGCIIIIVLFVLPPYIFTIYLYSEGNIVFERLIDLNIAVISITIIQFFGRIRKKRTSYGTEILGKIKGFKRFLKTAEKEQLEDLVEQNPEYFYDILPYTYALGVSKKWINQFETIPLKAPEWYDSRDSFDMHNFGTFMTKTMSSATTAMSSSPSSSGGSSSGFSSSGGGSSGGGSGGGGGGSW